MTINRKNVIWNIIGATFNAFNSLLFVIAVTRINGIDYAGIFSYCFATACLLYFIGNYLGRTFQVTDVSKKNSDTDYIYNRIFTCSVMIIITIVFALIKRYDMYKSTLFIELCLYKCIEAFAESLYAIIQKNGELYKVGISMFLKAIISLIALIIIDVVTHNLILAVSSIVIVNIFIIIIYDFKNIKKVNLIKTKFNNKANIRLLKVGFFTFILTFLATYLINAPRYAIDDMLENNIQTIFGIIIMPATLMGLLAQYIIQPALTKISNNIENKNYDELKKIVKILIYTILALGAIVLIVAWILEAPVLKIVYGIDLSPYHVSMMIIIVGSILYSLSAILSAVLIAMRKTASQAIMYFITAIIATVLSYSLVKQIQIQGASIAYLITMIIISAMFLIYVVYNMKKYNKEWSK